MSEKGWEMISVKGWEIRARYERVVLACNYRQNFQFTPLMHAQAPAESDLGWATPGEESWPSASQFRGCAALATCEWWQPRTSTSARSFPAPHSNHEGKHLFLAPQPKRPIPTHRTATLHLRRQRSSFSILSSTKPCAQAGERVSAL